MVLPELLGGVLAGHALEDLGAAGVLVDEVWRLVAVSSAVWGGLSGRPLSASPVVGLVVGKQEAHTGNIVDAVIDDDEHALLVLVLGDLGLGELLRHGGGWEWDWAVNLVPWGIQSQSKNLVMVDGRECLRERRAEIEGEGDC